MYAVYSHNSERILNEVQQ